MSDSVSTPVGSPRMAQAMHLLVGVGLLAVLSLSILWLVAELNARQVRSYVAEQTLSGGTGFLTDWQQADSNLQRAIALNPRQAEFYSLQAALLEWLPALTDNDNPDAELSTRNQAMAVYRQSIALRPAWPDAWMFLARQKAITGELDAELHNAMLQGLTLGKNEQRIPPLAIEVFGLSWPFFAGNEEITALLAD